MPIAVSFSFTLNYCRNSLHQNFKNILNTWIANNIFNFLGFIRMFALTYALTILIFAYCWCQKKLITFVITFLALCKLITNDYFARIHLYWNKAGGKKSCYEIIMAYKSITSDTSDKFTSIFSWFIECRSVDSLNVVLIKYNKYNTNLDIITKSTDEDNQTTIGKQIQVGINLVVLYNLLNFCVCCIKWIYSY